MSDTTTKQIEIVLKGRDDGSLNLLGQAERRVTSLAQALRQGGDIGELSGVKKFGKNLGEFLGTSQGGTISANAGQLRNQAAADYAGTLKGILETERQAEAVDKARVGAMLERSNAANRLKRELAAINLEEKRQLSRGATGLLKGEYGPAEIRDEANVSRAAAEKAYQEVLARSVDVQMRAAKSDEDRRKALLAKAEATRVYAKQLEQINTAEAAALKANGGTSLLRGVAVAGGTLAALNIAGGIAEAWDKANQKIEEGKIGANEFVGELAKGLPIIGGTVQKAESLLMIITGTAAQLREANKEAAELDKKIAGQNATRKRADTLVGSLAGINDSDKQAIAREAGKQLKEIEDIIAAGKADGSINEGSDRHKALQKSRANVIAKREKDLGEIEAKERLDRAKKIQDVENEINASNRSMHEAQTAQRIADLKEQGKDEQAAKLKIDMDADAKRAELMDKRRALEAKTGLTDSQRIALNGQIDRELQANEESRRAQMGMSNRASLRDVDGKIRDMNGTLYAAHEAQRQRDDEARAKALGTQQGARTSNFDGRGQTGFFNQSKSIEDNGKKTAENTKITADELKKLTQLIAQNALGSLTGGISL